MYLKKLKDRKEEKGYCLSNKKERAGEDIKVITVQSLGFYMPFFGSVCCFRPTDTICKKLYNLLNK